MLLCNHSFSHINFLTCDRIRNVSFFSFQSSIAADRRAARVVTSLNCCTCEQLDLRVSPLAVCFCRPCVPTVHCGLVGFVYLFSIFSFRALRCTCTFLFCGLQQLLGLGLGLSDCDWCTSKFTVSPLSRCLGLGLGLWLVTVLSVQFALTQPQRQLAAVCDTVRGWCPSPSPPLEQVLRVTGSDGRGAPTPKSRAVDI